MRGEEAPGEGGVGLSRKAKPGISQDLTLFSHQPCGEGCLQREKLRVRTCCPRSHCLGTGVCNERDGPGPGLPAVPLLGLPRHSRNVRLASPAWHGLPSISWRVEGEAIVLAPALPRQIHTGVGIPAQPTQLLPSLAPRARPCPHPGPVQAAGNTCTH